MCSGMTYFDADYPISTINRVISVLAKFFTANARLQCFHFDIGPDRAQVQFVVADRTEPCTQLCRTE